MDADKTEAELNHATLISEIDKMQMLLRMTGLNQKAIDLYTKLPVRFVQKQTDRVVQTADFLKLDIDWMELESRFISYQNNINSDLETVAQYRDMASSEISIKGEMLAMMRESYPHLTQFFNHIDLDPSKEIRDLNVKIRSYYVGEHRH